MALWRTQAKRIAIAALLAFAIQFVGTLGHMHQEWFGGSDAQAATGDSHSPDDHDHGKSADPCSICTAASIGHAFASAAVPVLVLPSCVAIDAISIDNGIVVGNKRRSAFNSRAPPFS